MTKDKKKFNWKRFMAHLGLIVFSGAGVLTIYVWYGFPTKFSLIVSWMVAGAMGASFSLEKVNDGKK